MNLNTFKLLFLAIIAIGLGVYVFSVKSNQKSGNYSAYLYIPNEVNQFTEIDDPGVTIDHFFSSNLMLKEFDKKELSKEIEDFWNQEDSVFQSIKSLSERLTFFKNSKGKTFYILQFDHELDSIQIKSNYNFIIEKGIVLASLENLAGIKEKFESKGSLSTDLFFENENKSKGNNKIKIYKKNKDQWSVYDVNFLPEQVFSSGIIKEKINDSKLKTEFDFDVLSCFPEEFYHLSITQFDEVSELEMDSNYLTRMSTKCECDAYYQSYNWVESPRVLYQQSEGSKNIISFKINSLANFSEGVRTLVGTEIEEENNEIVEIGKVFKFGTINFYPYFMRRDNLVYFSKNKIELEKLKAKILSGFNLASNEELSHFLETNINISSEEIILNRGMKLMGLSTSKGVSLAQKNFQSLELTYSSYIFSTKIKLDGGKVNPKWNLEFESGLYSKVYTVGNHKIGDNCFLVQNKNNELFFISPNGDIQWKKSVGSPIVGKIKTIDFLGNNKNQLIFTTKNQLYLVDVLGRKVGSFPVTIKDGITENVSVVDYDKNQNFRFLIPTSKGIKSVDGKGNIVKGWNQPVIQNGVEGDIYHLLINNLDYVLVRDKSNSISLFNRKGEVRHTVNSVFGNPFYFVEGSTIEKSRATYLDKTNNTISKQFFSNSNPSVLLSPSDPIQDFVFIDYNQDNQSEYVLIFKNKILIYGQDLIIQEKIDLLEEHKQLKIWKGGYGYINQFNQLIVNYKGKKSIVDNADEYLVDKYQNTFRILVQYKNTLKLLHL